MSMRSGMEHASIKSIKADYVKRTITVTVETSLEHFPDVDRDLLSEWAEQEATVDCEFSRWLSLAPLLEGVQ